MHWHPARLASRTTLTILQSAHGKVEDRHEIKKLLVERDLFVRRELLEIPEYGLHVALPMREKPQDRFFNLTLRKRFGRTAHRVFFCAGGSSPSL